MSEKRFWYDGAKVFDGEELLCCTLSIWKEQLVDLLNELAEENQRITSLLQSERRELIEQNNNYRKHLNELADENEQLEKEAEIYNEDAMGYQTLYEQQVEKNKFIIEQIKAFRDDCYTALDFDGASTLNRLLDILGEEH